MSRRPLGDRPMTPAERQRKYRDRLRGGPPVGRWPEGHMTMEELARRSGISRTLLYMARQVREWRPDLYEQMRKGELAVTRAYLFARHARVTARRKERRRERNGEC